MLADTGAQLASALLSADLHGGQLFEDGEPTTLPEDFIHPNT